MTRLDGRGYHPTVRPFIPHRKKESNKTKVMRIISPKAWQLAMMRLKMCFVADRDEIITLDKLFDLGLLDSSETTLMEPICGGEISCGTVGNYSMVHTDPSRPPPKNTWIHKAIQYIVVLLLAALMAMATACHKDPTPEPTPNHPTDTVTPNDTTNMHKKIIVLWDWERDFVPSRNTIYNYADRNDVDSVIMMPDTLSYASNNHARRFDPALFHLARQYLEEYIDYNPQKIKGGGIIYVNPIGGAHLSFDYMADTCGMSMEDSVWFTRKGWHVTRNTPPVKEVSRPTYAGAATSKKR